MTSEYGAKDAFSDDAHIKTVRFTVHYRCAHADPLYRFTESDQRVNARSTKLERKTVPWKALGADL